MNDDRSLNPPREVAVTFDDLPVISVVYGEAAAHRDITLRLLDRITAHDIPAVGFVNEYKLLTEGVMDDARVDLLRLWLDAGLELGNHTYSHMDLHRTALAEFQDDVIRGEGVIRELLSKRGMPLRYFRHPYLNTGTRIEVRRALGDFLLARGYCIAPVTIYIADYVFAAAYDRAAVDGDARMMRRVVDTYLVYVERTFQYFERESVRLFGEEIRQVLLLHANRLNADCLDDLAGTMMRRGYVFVTLEQALADRAYNSPDTYFDASGVSWLHRWAVTRGVSADTFADQPTPPAFVKKQAKAKARAQLGLWIGRVKRGVRRRIERWVRLRASVPYRKSG